LPGVNVVLKGTSTGTTTSSNGEYSINVPTTGATLVFSFIGLKSVEVRVESKNVIDVAMDAEVTQLQEVVSTGLAGKAAGVVVRGFRKSKVQSVQEYELNDIQHNTEEYDGINENIFHEATKNPLSTFSIDVDAASYSNVRRFINQQS
jgi:Ca-activated chloride channel homolog